jgi:hypothetical protein
MTLSSATAASLTVRDHKGTVLFLSMTQLLSMGSYATCGWDYLDNNGS